MMKRTGVIVAGLCALMVTGSSRADATPIGVPGASGDVIGTTDVTPGNPFDLGIHPPGFSCPDSGACDGGRGRGRGHNPVWSSGGEPPRGRVHFDNANVPDGGQTGILLGMAALGLALIRRRVNS